MKKSRKRLDIFHRKSTMEFDYNFYMQNAREQRGEDRLAAIVHITTP